MKTKDYFKSRYVGIIPNFDDFLASIEEAPTTLLRPNKIKMDAEDIVSCFAHYNMSESSLPQISDFRLKNYTFENEEFSLGGSLEHTMGYFYSQGYSSQLAVEALDPQTSDTILDLCAAPGGKTVLIAQKMNNKGMLVANELYRNRNIALKSNLDRMGVINCVVTNIRGEEFPETIKFDRILLDGPCSSEGTLRISTHADLPFKNDGEYRRHLMRTQKKLILRAFDLLKEGGVLLYSTCTYAPEENEIIVQYLLEERPQARIEDIDMDENLSDGLTTWESVELSRELRKTKRVYPHQIPSWGFYLAKITK